MLGVSWIFGVGSLLAIIFGNMARREIEASGGQEGGRGAAMTGIVLGWLGLAGVAIYISIAGGTFVVTNSAREGEVREELSSSLKNAATAEESHRTQSPRYTKSIADLRQEGFQPGLATVTIIEATANSYCIEAESSRVVMHYDSSEGIPKDGRCGRL